MPRKPNPLPEDVNANIDTERLAEDAKAIDQDRRRLEVIDYRFGDNLPYDRRQAIQLCRLYLQHSADTMLQAGKCLILIKEHEPQGEFMDALREIGINPRTARRMMQAAAKFDGPRAQLAQLGKTKLIELMVEDDDELEALAEGGTLAGQTLDAIDRMSSRELRETLRDERAKRKQETEVHDKLLADKNTKIDRLDKELQQLGLAPPAWPRIVDEVAIQTAVACNEALQACDKLDILRDRILTCDLGDRSDAEMEPAIERMAVEYFDCVVQVWSRVGQVWGDCRQVFEGHKMAVEERVANTPMDDDEPTTGGGNNATLHH